MAVNSPTIISTDTETIVVSPSPGVVQIISSAVQGPPGPPGLPGTGGGGTSGLVAVAGTTISANTAIALVNGQAVPAQSGDVSQAGNVVGISQNGGPAGTLIDIQQLGEMSLSSWNWVLGNPIFVGPNGPLTQTPPTAGFSQIVGVPISATSISIGLQAPVLIA